MRTIHKYVLSLGDTYVEMPAGAEILHVADQGGEICIWARVDTEAQIETRLFTVRGTGHSIHKDLLYVGTFLSGEFVWHVFERLAGEPR